MKIKITKESFGPWSIACSLEVDLAKKRDDGETNKDHYLALGALYEMERKPSSTAEKLFWSQRDKKGNLVRGEFVRAKNIPTTSTAQAAIKASLEASGYQDVEITLRDIKNTEPAWKSKVQAYVSLMELDEDMTKEKVLGYIKALSGKVGVGYDEMVAYAKL